MTTKITLNGFTLSRGADFSRGFTILGYGEVTLSDLGMTLRGCALAFLHGQLIALPPRLSEAGSGDLRAVIWGNHAPIATAICEKLKEGYEKMGGAAIPAQTQSQATAAAAARRVHGKADDAGLRRMLGAQ